jgi:hypothetical protein
MQSAPQSNAPEQSAVRQTMLPTIEKLFAHYEPKKRESVRRKLFPSLHKLFGISPQDFGDPLSDLEKISAQPQSSPPVQAVKEESEALASADGKPPEAKPQDASNFPFGQKKVLPEKQDLVEIGEDDHEVVGSAVETEVLPPLPPSLVPQDSDAEEIELEKQGKFYDLAYKIASTPGTQKFDLKREMNRIVSNFKNEVELSFKLAASRAKEEGLSNFTNLKPGMKNLSFAEMPISSIMETTYGPKKKPYLRVSLFDQKKEVAVLVPKERSAGISTTDRIVLRRVAVDFLVESNEIVLVVGKKSGLMVVK